MHTEEHTQVNFYISREGNDGWSGKLAMPNAERTDGPFTTLEAARDAIRLIRGKQPVNVWLPGGEYTLLQSFVLDERDSGTINAPIVYRSNPIEQTRLMGGKFITNFASVTNPIILNQLDEKARAHVLEADLAALGITDLGRIQTRGMVRSITPAHLELFFNGEPMTVARYPNTDAADNGFLKIAGFPEEGKQDDEHGHDIGKLTTGFFYDGDRPKRWATFDNIWLHGYWAWDWANSYEAVESIDVNSRLIMTKPPHGSWGYRTGNRFYFLNVLEELDAPGEYYVDDKTGKLYFYPPASITDAEVIASVIETPLVHMQNASHIELRGLVIEAGRGMGVQIEGGAGNRVVDCTLRNMGNHAVVIEGGTDHQVTGCHIHGNGDGGIFITGGDRKTLTPSNHAAHNNHIHHLSRWSRCYTPAISATGVGIRMTHNLIHDLPHSGIIFWGNDLLIEFNEIHHVTLESADAGAIYTGRDFTARGTVIRHNYVHDTGGYDWGTMGVYLDDCVSGEIIYGNVFARVQRATFIGGGRDNKVENNIFVDCKPAVWVDARGLDKRAVWHNMIYKTMKNRLEAMRHHQPPYSERYPELQQLDAYYAKDDGVPPEGNVIARNISVGGVWLESSWHMQASQYITVADNLVDLDPAALFMDPAHDDYRLKPDSPAYAIGFEPIPLDQIGLVRESN